MIINYKLIIFMYSPIILLLFLYSLRDRFKLANKVMLQCDWSLMPGIVVLCLFLNGEVIRSLWYANLFPVLNAFKYNYSNAEVFSFAYFLLLMLSVYIFIHFFYKMPLTVLFDYKSVDFYFILKLYSALSVINIFCIKFLDFNIFINQQELSELANTFDVAHVILFLVTSIVVGPIVEESIFRGLIYSPLYRKIGRSLAIVLSSLIWTQAHFTSLRPSIGIFVVGIFLAWLYDRKGSLIYPVVFHMFKNSWALIYFLK